MVTKKTKPGTETINRITGYIEKLVNTPSPTGFTNKAIEFLKENAEEKGIPFEITRKGAMIYKFETDNPSKSVMLAVHVDTLGAIVKSTESNAVKFDLLGGFPPEYIIGNYCTIHTFDGNGITGTIVHSNPAVHVNKELYEKKFKISDLVVRPDIKLSDDKDKIANYIEIGNFISFDPRFQVRNGFVKSRHLDDKASAGILLSVVDDLLEKMKKPGFRLDFNLYCFFNITEETGQGIAGYPKIDDFLAVDMGALGEGLSGDEFHVSICAKDATGPYHYDFTHELVKICKENEIPYKMDIFPHYGSDGSGALKAGEDIRVALIGPGVAASHGHERTHVDSLLGVRNLIQHYLKL